MTEPLTVLEVIKRTTDFLAGKGVESPRLNAELIVGHALTLKRMQLYLQFERPLDEDELGQVRTLVRRRGMREPLQHLLGAAGFCSLTLKVDRRVLIPRPETEHLVELICQQVKTPPQRILDLGTGSGAIALALASQYAGAEVVGVDYSPDALELARENAATNALSERVQWLQSDWFASLPAARFDLVVANPPYLSEKEVANAEPEVRDYEPRLALTPGGDGLSALQKIIGGAGNFLEANGLLALETGINQHRALIEEARRNGYDRCESRQDLNGRDRYIFAWRATLSSC